MNSIDTSSYLPPLAGMQNVSSNRVNNGADSDGDGDGGGRAHRSHGRGGQMQQAMMQALQSMGLSLPQQGGNSTPATQATGSTDADGDSDGSTSAASSVKKDLRQFMHALFQAVKSEKSSSSTGNGSSNNSKSDFASGLSALISQVSNGTAPSDLQSAFSKLVSDMQPASAAANSTSPTTTGKGTTTPPVSLQALLTQLQQNLGYGSTAAVTGNVISTYA